MTFSDWFARFSREIARVSGSPVTFVLALLVILLWALVGPLFRYSDTWQLVINTATTIVTFLMVFLIQNTQNRDATAMHIKLDELIRAVQGARNKMVNLEDLTEDQLNALKEQFASLAQTAEAVGEVVQEGLDDDDPGASTAEPTPRGRRTVR